MTEKTLLPREAAQRLGVSLQAVYALIWAGKLAGRKQGPSWAIPLSAVEARLKQRATSQR